MQDRALYARLLGIERPWHVTEVELRLEEEQAVVVSVALDAGAALACLRFAGPVAETVARLATGAHGLTPGRAGFAPAGRRIEVS